MFDADLADELLREMADRLAYLGVDYDARIYLCRACNMMDCAAAPAAELTDDFACHECRQPMEPVSDVLVSPRPNRAQRRERRRRR